MFGRMLIRNLSKRKGMKGKGAKDIHEILPNLIKHLQRQWSRFP